MQRRIVLLILLISLLTIGAAPVQEDLAVIRAVFFYTPTCPHCHEVINEHLPPLVEQYGPQLLIIGVNTATADGQELYQAMISHFELGEDRLGVPALIVGDTHLLGSDEIPDQLPGIIEEGLAQGGIDWPVIEGFEGVFQATLDGTVDPNDYGSAEAALGDGSVTITDSRDETMIDKFMKDPVANSVAVVVLVGMVVSIVLIFLRTNKPTKGLVVNSNLIWIIPVLCVAGLAVAGYLTFVEVSQTQAVCGPVGDCNRVQQSPYAKLFGYLHIGTFGLIGYALILISWALRHFGPEKFRGLATQAMWGLALFGTMFSIYLTYLEPFVIGATCAWCLGSAIIITLILWAATDPARLAWD